MKNANELTVTCKVFKKQIRAYIDNELSGSWKAAFIAHASQCKICGALLNDMEEVVKALASFKPVTSSSEFNLSLKTRVLLEKERLNNPFYRFSLFFRENARYFMTVPALVMIVFAFLVYYPDTGENFDSAELSGEISAVADSLGGMKQVAEEEENADEIVYVHYVLETVKPNDLAGGNNNKKTVTQKKSKPGKSDFKTVSF